MELFEYREASFNVIRTLSFERTPLYDEANNYLYTLFKGTIEVNYQPALAAYTVPPGSPPAAGNIPVATPGALPGRTDLALLTRLFQPRGLMRITAGSSVILESPAIQRGTGTRMPCDVVGGPIVTVVGVPLMVGFRHWIVTLSFETAVRDQIDLLGPPQPYQNAILTNTWVATEDIDYQRRSVRRFAGRAVLRADLLRAGRINANSLRDLYLFKCPDHYQRNVIHVELSEDGTTLDWSFEDTMRGYDLGKGSPILDIEVFRTGYTKMGSPYQVAVDTIRQVARDATLAVGLDVASGLTSLLAAPIAAGILAGLDNLPKTWIQCRCDITGDRNANLSALTAIAIGICVHQLGVSESFLANPAILTIGTAEVVFRQDIADKIYTSVEMTLHWTADVASIIDAARTGSATIRSLVSNVLPPNTPVSGLGNLLTIMSSNPETLVSAKGATAFLGNGPGGVGVFQNNANGDQVIADRTGAFYLDNPPMNQGAYGVVPRDNQGLGANFGVVSGTPVGTIPAGIEHLIVQALLGQGQQPPAPGAFAPPLTAAPDS
jgi:hypothetical protein